MYKRYMKKLSSFYLNLSGFEQKAETAGFMSGNPTIGVHSDLRHAGWRQTLVRDGV
jgi:hypothetical protein